LQVFGYQCPATRKQGRGDVHRVAERQPGFFGEMETQIVRLHDQAHYGVYINRLAKKPSIPRSTPARDVLSRIEPISLPPAPGAARAAAQPRSRACPETAGNAALRASRSIATAGTCSPTFADNMVKWG